MAAGWSVLGACYTTTPEVLNAFMGVSGLMYNGNGYFAQVSDAAFNPSTGVMTYRIRWDNNTLDPGVRSQAFRPCDTDFTPTPANAVIQAGTGNGTGVVLPPLTSVTPNTKFSSMGLEDVVLICCVLFACLFGFSAGVTTGKGIAK